MLPDRNERECISPYLAICHFFFPPHNSRNFSCFGVLETTKHQVALKPFQCLLYWFSIILKKAVGSKKGEPGQEGQNAHTFHILQLSAVSKGMGINYRVLGQCIFPTKKKLMKVFQKIRKRRKQNLSLLLLLLCYSLVSIIGFFFMCLFIVGSHVHLVL